MLGSKTSELIGQSKDLAVHSYQYYRLKLFSTLVEISADVIKLLIFSSLGLLAFSFFSIAGAVYLGEYFESTALGFIVMGIIVLLIIGVVYLMAKGNAVEDKMVKRLSNKFFVE